MKADDDDDDNGDDDYEMFLSKMGLMVHGRCTESQGTTRTCSDFQFSFGGTGVLHMSVHCVYTSKHVFICVYTSKHVFTCAYYTLCINQTM